jgi:hypothetical protein
MINKARFLVDRLSSRRLAGSLLVLAVLCLMSPRAHADAPGCGSVFRDVEAAGGALVLSPASFSIAHPAVASEGMAIRTRTYPRRYPRRQMISYAPRFRGMIAGGVGYTIPTGDWFSGMTSGFTAGGAVRLAVNERFYLGFSYDRQWLGIEKSFETLCLQGDEDYACYSVDWDIHLDEFFFLLGWMSPVLDDGSPFAYAEFGLGGIKHVIEAVAPAGGPSASVTTDETKFGLLIAVGGVFPFTREIGLNIEGTMRLTGESGDEYDPYYGSYAGSGGALFGFKVGLVAMLGS